MSRKGGAGRYWLNTWQLPRRGALRANGHWQQVGGYVPPTIKHLCAMYGLDYDVNRDLDQLYTALYALGFPDTPDGGLAALYALGFPDTPDGGLAALYALGFPDTPDGGLAALYALGFPDTPDGGLAALYALAVVFDVVDSFPAAMHYLPIVPGGVRDGAGSAMHYLPIVPGGVRDGAGSAMHYLPIVPGGVRDGAGSAMHYLPIIRAPDLAIPQAPLYGVDYATVGGVEPFPGTYAGVYGVDYAVNGGLTNVS